VGDDVVGVGDGDGDGASDTTIVTVRLIVSVRKRVQSYVEWSSVTW
jgi:hypothetical protein